MTASAPGPTSAVQIAAVDALLASTGVVGIVADTPDGPAVFARGQKFANRWPRVTLPPPLRIGVPTSLGMSADMFLTAHAWAKGDDAALVAADLADAVVAALSGGLVVPGWRVSSWTFLDARPTDDPDPEVEHFVIRYRFSIHGSD